MRVDLPDGGWVDMKNVDDLTGEDAVAVGDAIKMDADLDGHRAGMTAAIGHRMRNALLARIITGWSLDLPLPDGNPDAVAKVPLRAYRALHNAVREHMRVIEDDGAPNTERSSG